MQSPFLINLLEIFQFINNLCRCFILCYHSFSFVVPLVAIRYHSLSFVVTRCRSLYPRCHSLHHSLYFVIIPLVCLFINSRFFLSLWRLFVSLSFSCLNFCFLNNFEIVRFIVKSLVVVQRISVEVQLKKKT